MGDPNPFTISNARGDLPTSRHNCITYHVHATDWMILIIRLVVTQLSNRSTVQKLMFEFSLELSKEFLDLDSQVR